MLEKKNIVNVNHISGSPTVYSKRCQGDRYGKMTKIIQNVTMTIIQPEGTHPIMELIINGLEPRCKHKQNVYLHGWKSKSEAVC